MRIDVIKTPGPQQIDAALGDVVVLSVTVPPGHDGTGFITFGSSGGSGLEAQAYLDSALTQPVGPFHRQSGDVMTYFGVASKQPAPFVVPDGGTFWWAVTITSTDAAGKGTYTSQLTLPPTAKTDDRKHPGTPHVGAAPRSKG